MSNTMRHSSGQAARIRTATTSGGAPVSTDVMSGVSKCRFSARTCAEASSSKHTRTPRLHCHRLPRHEGGSLPQCRTRALWQLLVATVQLITVGRSCLQAKRKAALSKSNLSSPLACASIKALEAATFLRFRASLQHQQAAFTCVIGAWPFRQQYQYARR